MNNLNQTLQLTDGRKLGFNRYGPPDGRPLLYFHGSPSARIEFLLFGTEALLHDLDICVIAPDRPGCGLSNFQPERKFTDWPADVAALADHLGLDQFSIVGYSGGGPYAAVTSLMLPDRISGAGIVSGTGPFSLPGLSDGIDPKSRQFMDLSIDKPLLHHMILRMMKLMCRIAPGRIIANATAALPPPDQETVSQPEVQLGFLAMVQESLRHGPHGAQHDTALMVGPWDFKPQEIQIPVYLWHGERDRNAPVEMGRYMASTIPECHAVFMPGEGHLSLFKKHIREILQTVCR